MEGTVLETKQYTKQQRELERTLKQCAHRQEIRIGACCISMSVDNNISPNNEIKAMAGLPVVQSKRDHTVS